jgi:hypothetical protein
MHLNAWRTGQKRPVLLQTKRSFAAVDEHSVGLETTILLSVLTYGIIKVNNRHMWR